ncbi:TlyA family RNA methyltransferase [Candidatus Oleimmundimicrobium sp.]|uniref:TlyA family RNA methyltransferase n=1 Tax=Candidatus Oleimmundimicrobium sp. TaxID=3060597 RepID=UPI00271D7F0C|nr:TlyA family RNA methyltransferase [Candidatus Oleimmundimicrobium sp.]MDO8886523.1 TlyA family RNA methyltransferase [Candidatus Oleimmundimicrobium sp.]
MEKKRLDTCLVKLGKFNNEKRAKAAILEGRVFVDGNLVDKAGTLVSLSSDIVVRENEEEFVSRGGRKLEKALKHFGVDVKDRVVLDVGSSTGGFTDCLLKRGAKLVIAVDVGYGQLAWRLRKDPRVFVLERTNIRYLTPDKLPTQPNMVVIDVSFISVKKIIDNIKKLVKNDAEYLILIKPQFEAKRELIGKKGIVRDPKTHQGVLTDMWKFFEEEGFVARGLDFSPILGVKGNMEFLFYLKSNKKEIKDDNSTTIVEKVVSEAHKFLLKSQKEG